MATCRPARSMIWSALTLVVAAGSELWLSLCLCFADALPLLIPRLMCRSWPLVHSLPLTHNNKRSP